MLQLQLILSAVPTGLQNTKQTAPPRTRDLGCNRAENDPSQNSLLYAAATGRVASTAVTNAQRARDVTQHVRTLREAIVVCETM